VRYPGLDGLRGIAVALVVLFHVQWLSWGWVGVPGQLAVIGLTLAVSVTSWYLFEKPWLRLKDRWLMPRRMRLAA
jgi:peptidoglycan/LPS O-acetylase OafA/YrhL